MDQLIFASLSHTHYWYEAGMLEAPAVPCNWVSSSVFDYTFYFVTVGSSNTAQMRLLGNYPGMLERLEFLLCCPWSTLIFFLIFTFFPFPM